MAWQGKQDNRNALAAIRKAVAEAASSAVTDGSGILQNQQRLNATRRPGPLVRTGSLLRGIKFIPTRQVSEFVFQGGTKSTVVYARIQELGGTIYPKRGMFLVWTDGPRPTTKAGWKSAQKKGLVHRARHVTIPARPYFAPAIPEVAPRYRELAARRVGFALSAR